MNQKMFTLLLFLMVNSLMLFIYLWFYNKMILIEWTILNLKSMTFEMTIIIDQISTLFTFVIMLISSSIFMYSSEYMYNELNKQRFYILLFMFVMSMLLMVYSPNLISILLGWDGLGLVSYALVIFYQNEASVSAGTITVLSNRVGDVAILLCIGIMFNFHSYSFFLTNLESNFNNLTILLCILAAFTKSAQIPFSAWLPAAMAAPTPVSSLVHSSTLVTAGVYLLIRFSSSLTPFLFIMLIAGTYTMVMSGMAANFETDLKKIIALSTLSQLGLMMVTLGLNQPILTFFHLLTHALFKALLFMTAGSLIHAGKSYQDMRSLSGLIYFMPLTASFMIIANLALCGMPFLAGFYSKDLIIEMMLMKSKGILTLFMLLIATGLTVMYTFQMINMITKPPSNYNSLLPAPESFSFMTASMTGLGLASLISGSMLTWMILPSPAMICMSHLSKFITLIVCLCGIILGLFMSKLKIKLLKEIIFISSMWYLTKISTIPLTQPGIKMSIMAAKLDSGWMEYKSAQKINFMMKETTKLLEMNKNSTLKLIMYKMLIWIILLFMYLN